MIVEKDFWDEIRAKLLIHTEGKWLHKKIGLRAETTFEAQCFSSCSLAGVRYLGSFTIIRAGGALGNCRIGRFTSIGQNFVCSPPEHPTTDLGISSIFLKDYEWNTDDQKGFYKVPPSGHKLSVSPTKIGNDVWIGRDVFVKGGVSIGDGAIVAARSVVTKDVPPYSIVAGVPAKVVSQRFPENIAERFLRLRWWNYDPSWMKEVDTTNPEECLDYLDKYSRLLKTMEPRRVTVRKDSIEFL